MREYELMALFQTNQDTPNTKSLTIDIRAALGVLGGAVLISIVGTAFTVARVVNSDHFLLQSTALAVTQIQSGYIRSDVYNANEQNIDSVLRDIKNQLISLDNKIK